MNLKPTFNRLIVKGIKENESSTGGIVIPEQYRNTLIKLKKGTVTALGPGKQREDGSFLAIGLKLGDTVTFDLLNSLPFESDGDEYFMLDYINVLATEQSTSTDNIVPFK